MVKQFIFRTNFYRYKNIISMDDINAPMTKFMSEIVKRRGRRAMDLTLGTSSLDPHQRTDRTCNNKGHTGQTHGNPIRSRYL